jgi:microcystin-dependent protein
MGDATSGANIRANADTSALFALYYNSYSDSNCPLTTSTGTGTTRALQGTAATAFAAHCRVTLPKGAGRALGISGTGAGLTARTLGSVFGEEKHTQLVPELAAHSHTFNDGFGSPGANPLGQPVGGEILSNFQFAGTDSVSGVSMNSTGTSTPFNVMQPTTFVNIMVKL